MSVCVSLSFWTYWSTKDRSFLGNIGNTLDLFSVWSMVPSMLFLGGENVRLGFTSFEWFCLALCGGIFVFWRRSKRHVVANTLLQAAMVVAYLPLLWGLWIAQENPESPGFWLVALCAILVAFVPATIRRDKLGLLYNSRALALCIAVFALMIRIELRH